MTDDQLQKNKIYWIEMIDKDSTLFGKQFKVMFKGIFFENIEDNEQKFYLWQLKIFREYRESDTQPNNKD